MCMSLLSVAMSDEGRSLVGYMSTPYGMKFSGEKKKEILTRQIFNLESTNASHTLRLQCRWLYYQTNEFVCVCVCAMAIYCYLGSVEKVPKLPESILASFYWYTVLHKIIVCIIHGFIHLSGESSSMTVMELKPCMPEVEITKGIKKKQLELHNPGCHGVMW